jgi:NAD(P)-dependent dehydrogenase (short-subunit alcohol dehydrogenase family)
MSSIAAWRGVAVGGPYSASKFALEGMSFVFFRSVMTGHSERKIED